MRLPSYSYDYDDNSGNHTRKKSLADENIFVLYTYNNRSEVISATSANDTTYDFDYSFDSIGNRLSSTSSMSSPSSTSSYITNNLNQYTEISTGASLSSPSYDNDGNMLTMTDKNGVAWTYTWNAENRLVSAIPDTPVQGMDKAAFKYDYMGRRAEKTTMEWLGGQWKKQTNTYFIYDSYKLIDEKKYNDREALIEHRKYVWNGESPFSMTDDDGTFYYVLDANKNVTELIDSSGAVRAHYEYSPFGKITNMTGDKAEDNPFRFSSEYHDNETGLVYYNYRYYSPEFGRWLNRDPIEENGGYNLYAMVSNNSINHIDYLGQKIKSVKVLHDVGYSSGYFWTTWNEGGYHGSVEQHAVSGPDISQVLTDYDDIGDYVHKDWFFKSRDYTSIIRTKVSSGTNTGIAYQYGSISQTKANPKSGHIQHSSHLKGTMEVTGCCDSGYASVIFIAFGMIKTNVVSAAKGDGTGAWGQFSKVPLRAKAMGPKNQSDFQVGFKLETFPSPNDTTKTYSFDVNLNLNIYAFGEYSKGMAMVILYAKCLDM